MEIESFAKMKFKAICIDKKYYSEIKRLAEIGRVTEFAIDSGYEFSWGKEYFMNFEQMKKTMELENSHKPTTEK